MNGEDLDVAQLLANRSIQHYKNLFGSTKLIIIDEAQKIPEIGKILKLMVDGLDGIKIIITGSSAFDLSQNTGEPLTGRKKTFHLFALSESELNQVENRFQKPTNLRERLVFGNYPELQQLLNQNEKIDYLKELVQSYLLKDILQFENIRNSDKILKLLRLIAFQSGSEISYTELGKQLSMSKNTIERYLTISRFTLFIH
ncbi:MAG: AAA family ATPase [Saprospiraceae bacterium]